MASRLFQGVLHQMKDTTSRVIGVVDYAGEVVACTDLGRLGTLVIGDPLELQAPGVIKSGSLTFRRISSFTTDAYYVFVEGEDAVAADLTGALSVTLGSIKSYYDERYDKASFMRSVILDSILPGDINIKARDFGIGTNLSRVVYLIRFVGSQTDNMPMDMISNLFPKDSPDTVALAVDEKTIALVKDLPEEHSAEDIERTAHEVVDTISSDYFVSVEVGIGSPVENLRDLARSYKEAQFALDVGRVFGIRQSVASYGKLGIGRLIYQLPTTLCEMFLHEVLSRGTFEALDEESLTTINCFFENNLNVSETARKLYIHRNTLVYRLDKIKRLTGLDLREFDSAITFKVAIMVKQYLDAGQNG